MPIRLLVIDGQPVTRAGLQAMLAGTGVDPVGEASTASDAVMLAGELKPHAALLDLRLTDPSGIDRDGLEFLSGINGRGIAVPTLIFTAYKNPTYAARALALGAVGYLMKTVGRDDLVASIKRAATGESCWSRDERRRLTGALATERFEDDLEAPLTRRESEVLKQLAFGLTNRDIAEALGISYETVKEHVQHILRKLGAGDRTQAAVWAVRRGLA